MEEIMKYILLDLDGTITDPKIGITKSVQYALKSKGIHIEDLDSLCRHIGPPLKTSFMEFYGFSEREAEELVEKYREYFKDTGIYENEVFEGMDELLKKLRAAGKKLITATSKPEVFAKRILEYFHLDQYFDDICGATLDSSRISKEDVIRYALEKNGIWDLSEVIMVGDREHDIIGARKVGIASLGVLFGYGSRQELEQAGATRLALTVAEVYDVIIDM
jgi:phosphoglycolate phosphatase